MPNLEADGLQKHKTALSFRQEQKSEATVNTDSRLEKQLVLSSFSELIYLIFETIYTETKLHLDFYSRFFLCAAKKLA